MNNWEIPKGKGKGPGVKGEPFLRTDPWGGAIYESSTWALKPSERSSVGAMPLLSEFVRYQQWETAAKRWKNLLYNHPVSHIVEYFIINFKSSDEIADKTAGDF